VDGNLWVLMVHWNVVEKTEIKISEVGFIGWQLTGNSAIWL
jgi:hypothetical protein